MHLTFRYWLFQLASKLPLCLLRLFQCLFVEDCKLIDTDLLLILLFEEPILITKHLKITGGRSRRLPFQITNLAPFAFVMLASSAMRFSTPTIALASSSFS